MNVGAKVQFFWHMYKKTNEKLNKKSIFPAWILHN